MHAQALAVLGCWAAAGLLTVTRKRDGESRHRNRFVTEAWKTLLKFWNMTSMRPVDSWPVPKGQITMPHIALEPWQRSCARSTEGVRRCSCGRSTYSASSRRIWKLQAQSIQGSLATSRAAAIYCSSGRCSPVLYDIYCLGKEPRYLCSVIHKRSTDEIDRECNAHCGSLIKGDLYHLFGYIPWG